MRVLIVFFMSMLCWIQSANGQIRESFEHADESAELAEVFFKQASALSNSDLSNAYLGGAYITKAKYEKGIKNKKALIVKGADLLDNAVKNKPKDLEIRLIRLIIQENVPNIVKYKMFIQEDKKVILEHYSSQSTDIKKWISGYAKKSKAFTTEERKKLL